MPSQSHSNKTVTIRPDRELHQKVKAALAGIDSNVNAHVVKFFEWLVHETDELPERPPAEPNAKSEDSDPDA